MLRIREAESTQTVCDLRQRIAELEVQVKIATTNRKIYLFKYLFSYVESRINNS
mgnify:CR=1 FL=1